METWKTHAIAELRAAVEDRKRGQEGRARVRARRAANHLVAAYLQQQGLPDPGPSVIDRLQQLLALEGLPPRARLAAERLLRKVNPDYTFPSEIDLIEEVQALATTLFGQHLDLNG